jgi:TatD DNase family protein
VLWGGEEPDLQMLRRAVSSRGGLNSFREFVWCGYGEPTFRLDLIKQAADWLRSCGAKVRLNTNGHACLINRRDVIQELSKAVDEVSISMNAPDCERYLELCRPCWNSDSSPRVFWEAMLDFLARSPEFFENTQASIVGFVLSSEEIERCRSLAASLGVAEFRVR